MQLNRKSFKQIRSILISLLFFSPSVLFAHHYDLTVAGIAIYTEALGRLAITTIDSLKNDLKLNFIPTDAMLDPSFIPSEVLEIMQDVDKSYAAISLIFRFSEKILNECTSKIKFFYTMTESSAIFPGYGDWLSRQFDALIVPDAWLIEVYQKGGVTIPIFVLPCPIDLKEFFNQLTPNKPQLDQPFVFGTSGAFVTRKNHINLLEAFIQEFGNTPNVKLKLHGRWGEEDQALYARVEQAGVTNVEIVNKTFSPEEYINFLTSLNCYVFLSKGEGYSITPREALACGIPCILTNHTAHTLLCDSGLVKSVSSKLLEVSPYGPAHGYVFNCKIHEVCKAMQEIYGHYRKYLKIALAGKKWMRKFDHRYLRPYYISLAKPKKIVWGTKNKIERDFIMTNSLNLFNKYKELGFES